MPEEISADIPAGVADPVDFPRLPSIRLLIILIVCLPVAIASTILVLISTDANRRIAGQLRNELIDEANSRVSDEIETYLGDAVRVSDHYTRRLKNGQLRPTDLAAWQPFLFDDLATHAHVASICFGNPAGDAVYLQHAHNRLELGFADGSRNCRTLEYSADAFGKIDRQTPLRDFTYDPRLRPWYEAAMKSDGPIWTPIYFWFGSQGVASETGTGYTRAIRGADGSLSGALVVDVTLWSLSNFLSRLPLAQSGYVYLVDNQDRLVASSIGSVVSAKGERIALSESDNPGAGAVAAILDRTINDGRKVSLFQSQGLQIDSQAAWATIAPLSPYSGIHWRIITVVPDSSIMASTRQTQHDSILLAIATGLAALLLGLWLSRRLAKPLMRLADHVQRVGGGDFDSRLTLGGAKELRDLSNEVNRMASGLRRRLELEQSFTLATHVQKSLLPLEPPIIPGIDLAGQSRYCESTGGDYYDFIDIATIPEGKTLIVVGDVMGHGIGAALLMATARGSLRGAIACGNSLGELMTRVNHVLAKDARHGMFMTMSMLTIDPVAGTASWTSAGHDPPIVYDPKTDTFRELEGANIPLGIMDGTNYPNFKCDSLNSGCVVVVGTDGIWEARNEQREMFGKERLMEVIRAAASGSAKEMAKKIETTLAAFVGHARVLDDVTFVIAKLTGESSEMLKGN